jgi:hypothetical protein
VPAVLKSVSRTDYFFFEDFFDDFFFAAFFFAANRGHLLLNKILPVGRLRCAAAKRA